MIDVVVSDNCPHCETQMDIMKDSFFPDEYTIISVGSAEFAHLDCKEKVDAVPFVIVRDAAGGVFYAKHGVHDGTDLRKLTRGKKPFNLHKQKAAQSS